MFLAILITVLITAPIAALAVSYAEYAFGYNLFDLLKDKVTALRASLKQKINALRVRVGAFLEKAKAAVLGLPAYVLAAIRRRL